MSFIFLSISINIHSKSMSISQVSVSGLPGANLHDSHGGGQCHAEANRKHLGPGSNLVGGLEHFFSDIGNNHPN